jgi:hypothetical protein
MAKSKRALVSHEYYLKHKDYFREYNRKYRVLPRVKKRMLEYQNEYYKRPYVKKRIHKRYKIYIKRPGVKLKRKKYTKKYFSNPMNKARFNEWSRQYAENHRLSLSDGSSIYLTNPTWNRAKLLKLKSQLINNAYNAALVKLKKEGIINET